MTVETGQHQPLLRPLMLALTAVLVCQFLFGFALHMHTLADCGSPNAVHSDYQQFDQHPDQVDLTPEKLANASGDDGDAPAILFLTVLLLAWLLPKVRALSLPGSGPPLPSRYASHPQTRAPPIA